MLAPDGQIKPLWKPRAHRVLTKMSYSFLFKGMRYFMQLPAFARRELRLLHKSLEDTELERVVAVCSH